MLSCVNALLLLDDDDDILATDIILMNLNQQLLHFMHVLTYWQCTPKFYTLMDMPLHLPLQQLISVTPVFSFVQ